MTLKVPTGASLASMPLRIAKELTQPSPASLLYASERQRARIISRTYRGVDVDGNPFTAYKPAYAKRKEKSGRDSGTVNLSWSGLMLKALQSFRQVSGNPMSYFLIGIYGREGLRAAVHNEGRGKMPQRHFVAASAQDRTMMAQDVAAHMMAAAKGTVLNG
jgi:hypothetical protein